MAIKLTKKDVKTILRKKIMDCSKDELYAIFKILGLQIKEWRENKEGELASFEVHHRMQYIIDVEPEKNVRAVSFNNEWVNWGGGTSGLCMGIEDVGELMLIILNLFVEKLHIRFEGPRYTEDGDREYENMEEMQGLLETLQKFISK